MVAAVAIYSGYAFTGGVLNRPTSDPRGNVPSVKGPVSSTLGCQLTSAGCWVMNRLETFRTGLCFNNLLYPNWIFRFQEFRAKNSMEA